MSIQTITLSDSSLIPESLRTLYFDSFPPEERRSWESIMQLTDDSSSPFNMTMIMREGEIAGFITWWRLNGARYVEHFAVIPAMRGGGLGGKAIRNFVAADPMPVILEVEPSGSNDMADRRIAFYERCGFTGHRDFMYIQPPYSPGLPEVPLMLMTSAPGVDLKTTSGEIHSRVYGVSGGEPQAEDRLPEDR